MSSKARRVSIGAACVNAIARWLSSSLTKDITVYDHWPASARAVDRTVTVHRISRRMRDDAFGFFQAGARTNLSATQAQVAFKFGDISQPVQIDVWATSDDSRDDIVAQLDDVLYAGVPQTMNVPNGPRIYTGNPSRDGILLPLLDGYQGDTTDVTFDDVEIEDSPESIERREYRAIYVGVAHASYTVTRVVPRLVQVQLKAQSTEQATPPPLTVLPYNTVTLTPNSNPPPVVKTTRGTSTS